MKKKSSNKGCLGAFLILFVLAIIIVNSNDDDYSSETTSYSSNITTKYSKVSLNVRKKPNVKSRELKVLKPNEKVTTNGKKENGFTQILNSNNQNYGWCATRYLQDSPLSESQLADFEGKKKETLKKRANAWENIDNSIGSFTDFRDGKNYKTVKIGTQIWMAENLAYKNSSGCWAYDNKESNVITYGYLYDWETAKNVCPSGWHLPSDAEWTQLTNYLGGEKVAGGKLKETGTTHWKSPNKGATNETGFTALPGGSCFSTGAFFAIGGYGYWWSATEATEAGTAWFRTMFDYADDVVRDYGFGNEMGLSVRCLKSEEKINSTNESKKEFDFAEVDKKDKNSGFVDPFSLKPGEKWSISKETPLMPEIAPSNPMEALEKVKYIPAENYIFIVSVREKENNIWYEVEVLNENNDLIAKGWINSKALIGQTLKPV